MIDENGFHPLPATLIRRPASQVRDLLALLAGKKARVLHRNPDKSTVLQVEDPNDEVMVIVYPDGSMYEERMVGLAGLGEAWGAASPADKVLVPDDVTGQKVWTSLEPNPNLSLGRGSPMPERFVGRNKTEPAAENGPRTSQEEAPEA